MSEKRPHAKYKSRPPFRVVTSGVVQNLHLTFAKHVPVCTDKPAASKPITASS